MAGSLSAVDSAMSTSDMAGWLSLYLILYFYKIFPSLSVVFDLNCINLFYLFNSSVILSMYNIDFLQFCSS